MFVDGELMLLHHASRATVDGESACEVDVLRPLAPQDRTHWQATPRSHKKGAPVTHSHVASIYVHAKTMVVDDVFVSIGSANVNRRGFCHDGEINAFAIPSASTPSLPGTTGTQRSALIAVCDRCGSTWIRRPRSPSLAPRWLAMARDAWTGPSHDSRSPTPNERMHRASVRSYPSGVVTPCISW